MEEHNTYPPGSLVQVTSYSPFRGLNGTIQIADTISDDLEELFCFYLVALEGTQIKEPMLCSSFPFLNMWASCDS